MPRINSNLEKQGLRILRQAAKIPRFKSPREGKALLDAIGYGRDDLAVWLLKHGVDPNSTNERKRNALWHAAFWCREAVVKELLRRGASLPDDVLMVPINKHKERIIRWLIKQGANVNCVARDPKAKPWDQEKRVLLTEALAAAATQPMTRKARTRKRGTAPETLPLMLIRAGAKVNRLILERSWEPPTENRSMLGLASYYGLLKTVRAMLAVGADVNLRDNRGRTALFDAASRGHLSVARELLRAGARTDIRDSAGLTSLEVVRREERSPAMVGIELCISAGGQVKDRQLNREKAAWQRRREQMCALLQGRKHR